MTEENRKYIYGGRYEVQDLVGKGSYSWVAKAFDVKLRRTVCIKVSYPQEGMNYDDRVRAFRTEAELGASLFHPNIVRVLDFCFMQKDISPDEEDFSEQEHGEPIIVMDYIEGVKLWTFTEKNELSISRVVDVGIQIATALVYTHGLPLPVIHRDIREANVLINKEGHVFLTDWGVSRKGKSLVTTRVAKGTYGFMAPEVMDIQLAAKLSDAFVPIDGRADLFSLGVLLYKLVSRQLPFQNLENIVRLREDIRAQNFSLPSELNSLCPQTLEDIIIRLLKEDPNERFQQASELLESLKKLVQVVGPAPIHDCETIVPDVLLAKEYIDKPLSSVNQETTTYISDVPQEIPPKINPKLRMYAIAALVILGIFVFYKTMMTSPTDSNPGIRLAVAQEPEKKTETIAQLSTPEQFEKLLDKKQHAEPSNIQRIKSSQTVEKLGDNVVVYSRDSTDQQTGYTMIKNYGVIVGTTFEAVITHEIETSNISSPVRALLTKDVIVKGKAIFPKGSKLLGGAIGDQNERIQVAFDRIILPDNKEVEFDGSALDENGALGIKGKVDREKTKRMSAGAGRVLSGAASGILDAVTGGSVAGQALNSGGQEAVDLTSNEVDFNNQAATVVRLQKDAPIKVYVKRSF